MAYIKKKLKEEQFINSDHANQKFRIKLKWKAAKDDSNNGGYSAELLNRFLSKVINLYHNLLILIKIIFKYGDITVLVLSPKKKGSALVEYSSRRAAEMAVDFEKGLDSNPLQLEWVNGMPSGRGVQSSTIKPSDYESVVLTKMRQAEERKRLIEQMMAEDKNNET